MRWLRRRRTPVRPKYERRFEEPRPINIPDWELLEEVEALLRFHPEEGPDWPYSAFGDGNNPVALNVATVADMRAKVEESGLPLWAIRIRRSIDDPKLVNRLSVKLHLTTGRREVIVSADEEDEASVDDMWGVAKLFPETVRVRPPSQGTSTFTPRPKNSTGGLGL